MKIQPLNFNVLSNDSDVDGDLPTVSAIDGTAIGVGASVAVTGGSVRLESDGTLTFTPATNFSGTPSFSYTITDGNGASDTANVVVTVNSINDAPVNTIPGSQSVSEDGTLVLSSANGNSMSVADVDAASNNLTVTLSVTNGNLALGSVSGVTVSGNSSSNIVLTGAAADINNALDGLAFSPAANFNGAVTLSMTSNDNGHSGTGGPLSATSTVAIQVDAVNDAPVASNDSATTDEDNAVNLAVLSNDTDVEASPLTVTAVDGLAISVGNPITVSNGVVNLEPDGTLSFTPDAHFNGTANFSYRVADNDGATDTALATVTVNPIPDAPIAANDNQVTPEDIAVSIDVLANDLDADGDLLTITQIDGNAISAGASVSVTNGSVRLELDDTLTFTPAPGFNGLTSFGYTIDDGNGLNASATVSVDVGAVNDAPIATDDSVATAEDTIVSLAVLGNDTDPDGDALSITAIDGTTVGTGSVVPVTGGSVEVQADGSLTFTPSAHFNGLASFNYTVGDGNGAFDTASASVSVNPVNDAPVVTVPGTQSFAEDNSLIFSTANGTVIAVSDVDAGSADLTVTLSIGQGDLTLGSTAGLVVAGNGSANVTLTGPAGTINAALDGLVYTPAANQNGLETLTVQTSDNGNTGSGGPQSTSSSVQIQINAVNDTPLALNDSASTTEDNSIVIDVLNNDVDDDGDALTITAINSTPVLVNQTVSVTDGQVTLRPDGTLLFAPNADFNGVATFDYSVSDTNGASATASVNVTVSAVNDAPVIAVPGLQLASEDTAFTFSSGTANPIVVSDVDAGAAPLTVSLSVPQGTLLPTSAIGVTISGAGTGSVTLTGAAVDLNTALDGLIYSPGANQIGTVRLDIIATDNGNTGSGGPLASSSSVDIQLDPVNDQPINSVPGLQNINEDSSLTFSALGSNAITLSDLDAASAPISVDLTVTDGTLTVGSSAGVTIVGDISGSVTLTGSQAALNAALDGLTYTPTAGANGLVTLSMVTNDNGNTGAGGPLTATSTVDIQVAAVNDAPLNIVPGPQTSDEDTALTFSVGNGNAISVSDPDAGAGCADRHT